MSKSLKTFLVVLLGVIVVGGGIWLYSSASGPEVPDEPAVIALPTIGLPPRAQMVNGFIEKMEELGYEEGVHVTYERPDEPITPNPEGMEKIREKTREYVEQDVDAIIVSANPDANIALEETERAGKDIPVVGIDVFDPTKEGLAESFTSSGNNFTGVVEKRVESVGKFLDMLTKVVPEVETLGVLTNGFMIPSAASPAPDFYAALQQQADKFGIELVEYTTNASPGPELRNELERVLDNVEEGEVDAWTHIPGHFIKDQQVLEHEMGMRADIPVAMPATIEVDPETGETIGLFAYGADYEEKGAQTAAILDKILRGSEPSEIPIESPTSYSLIINQRFADEIGIEIPENVLQLADRIVE